MTHSTRAQQALARLPEVDPAIAALALWCTYRDWDSPTQTKGETIFLGPEFPLLPISEQTGLMAHHVLHVALRHSARRATAAERYGAQFGTDRFDLACDALVNEALLQGGHALPRPAVRAADLVALLPKRDRPDNVLTDWDAEKLYTAIADSSGSGDGQGDSVAQYAKAQGFKTDLADSTPDASEADVWAGRIEQAMSAGRQAGTGIGAVVAQFGDLPNSRVPWEIKLRRLLGKALAQHSHQTYRRPGRAWLARDALAQQTNGAQPVFEPGLARAQDRPRLVIGLDTSSSVTPQMRDLFATEAASIVRRTGAEAHLLGFDTEVHSRHRLTDTTAMHSISMQVGGGTDFEPFLREAQTHDPSLVVVLTDLDAPTLMTVSFQVLWVVLEPPPSLPSFGEVLVIEEPA